MNYNSNKKKRKTYWTWVETWVSIQFIKLIYLMQTFKHGLLHEASVKSTIKSFEKLSARRWNNPMKHIPSEYTGNEGFNADRIKFTISILCSSLVLGILCNLCISYRSLKCVGYKSELYVAQRWLSPKQLVTFLYIAGFLYWLLDKTRTWFQYSVFGISPKINYM